MPLLCLSLSGCNDSGGETAIAPPVNENSAPVLNDLPGSSVQVDSEYRYQLNVTDADNDPITFNALAMPSWLSFSDTGLLSGTPSAADIGSEYIALTYSDGTVTM